MVKAMVMVLVPGMATEILHGHSHGLGQCHGTELVLAPRAVLVMVIRSIQTWPRHGLGLRHCHGLLMVMAILHAEAYGIGLGNGHDRCCALRYEQRGRAPTQPCRLPKRVRGQAVILLVDDVSQYVLKKDPAGGRGKS